MSGSLSSRPVRARCTQSVGVPATLQTPLAQRLGADRLVQRQRIGGAGAIAVRPDNRDLVAGLAQAFGQGPYAGGVDTVVVADQDSHAPHRGGSPRL